MLEKVIRPEARWVALSMAIVEQMAHEQHSLVEAAEFRSTSQLRAWPKARRGW